MSTLVLLFGLNFSGDYKLPKRVKKFISMINRLQFPILNDRYNFLIVLFILR